MKHGRPHKPFAEADGRSLRVWGTGERGWRRCHAHRVWSAIQAVLAVICVDEVHGHTKWATILGHDHPYVVAGWSNGIANEASVAAFFSDLEAFFKYRH